MCGRLKNNRSSCGLGKEYGTGFHEGYASASQKVLRRYLGRKVSLNSGFLFGGSGHLVPVRL